MERGLSLGTGASCGWPQGRGEGVSSVSSGFGEAGFEVGELGGEVVQLEGAAGVVGMVGLLEGQRRWAPGRILNFRSIDDGETAKVASFSVKLPVEG
jgi:hypothetical protein